MKELSIIITNYNKGDRIITLLKQLEEQILYKNDVQVIIIDDCSTDGSTDKIKDFINNTTVKDTFTLNINSENLGPGLSRNKGLDLCKGNWITFIDGDDEIKPQYIGTLFNWMKFTDADLISFDYEAINCINNDNLTYAYNTMIWSKLYRADIFYKHHIRIDENKFRGMIFGEDIELLYLYMSKTDKYLKKSEKLIQYNWGIGICNKEPERYESSISDGWFEEHEWLFKFNQSDIVLDFIITTHCNRNCSNCIALIPQRKLECRKFDDINDMKHRLNILLPEVSTLSIVGGEPLLHPNLIDIIKYIKNSGLQSIFIHTNGTVEPDNLQEILDIMDSRFTIRISKYPDTKIFDYTKYKVPYGFKWRIDECDWFYCGPLKENNYEKIEKNCIPKTCANYDNKIYLCHRMRLLDEMGIKLQDNEWCYVEDFKDFKKIYHQSFTDSCKYCLVGTKRCINIPSGS